LSARETANRPVGRKATLLAAAGYLLFIVYGSLVPLDFDPRPLDAAWRDFLAVRYYVLGVESRADWVANGLLYMPLGYLLSAGIAVSRRSFTVQLLLSSAVFLACGALALGVEFTQLFFPPRTVSINDIVAEFVGSALGIVVWLVWGGALGQLQVEMRHGGALAIRAAVVVYVLAYLTLSLFPYDFYVSAQELFEKIAAGGFGLLVAPAMCDRWSVCIAKLGAEVVVVIPLGIFLSMVLGKTSPRAYVIAAWSGVALGFVIEAAQLLIASGISQGISLLTRALGLALGVVLHRRARREWFLALQPIVAPALLMASVPYLLALMYINGWFSGGWVSFEQAQENMSQVRWLPFYYHYFTTETRALVSALAVAAMYLPVGIGCWLWQFARAHQADNGAMATPAGIAAVLGGIMEGGKLFAPGNHPDPTNVLIAGASAALTYFAVNLVYRWSLETETAPPIVVRPSAEPRAPAASGHQIAPLAGPLLLLAAVGTAIAYHPLPGPWLFIALTAYGFFIWRYPSSSLPAVLALLPLLNFARWTGWVLLNEFDLLMGVTLAVHLLKRRVQPEEYRAADKIGWLVAPLAASFLISAAIGFVPLQTFNYDAMNGYWSNFNSLRTLKGFLWAWALLPLMKQQAGHEGRLEQGIVTGMVLGLGAEAIMVAWDRFIFTGLFNFSNDYRALGTFPELHTGGGDVHAYLVLAIPFCAAWVLARPGAVRIVAGGVLFALASYALAVTFTRGGYVGYFGAIFVLAIALTLHWVRQRAWNIKRIAIAGVLALAGLTALLPIMMGPFMQSRLADMHGDAETRTRHWLRALDMMASPWSTALFGMGLGSFPRTFLLVARNDATATFSYKYEDGNGFVRLGSGRALYLGQWVSVEAGRNYTLAVDLRSSHPDARLGASICEKSEQNSFQCNELGFQVKETGTNWQHQEIKFNSNNIGSGLGRFHLRRPVFFSFSNAERNAFIDIDNVRLLDESNRDLIANGDFTRGGARWYFVADDHLPWHIFNLWVQILFEQGWLGVLAFGAMVMVALMRLAGRVWRGDVFAGTLLAGISGFLLIGLTESLFDGPRVTTLFFLLLFAALRRT
jgi:VanZ family protein